MNPWYRLVSKGEREQFPDQRDLKVKAAVTVAEGGEVTVEVTVRRRRRKGQKNTGGRCEWLGIKK